MSVSLDAKLSKTKFSNLKVLIPNNDLILEFHQKIKPVLKILAAQLQILVALTQFLVARVVGILLGQLG